MQSLVSKLELPFPPPLLLNGHSRALCVILNPLLSSIIRHPLSLLAFLTTLSSSTHQPPRPIQQCQVSPIHSTLHPLHPKSLRRPAHPLITQSLPYPLQPQRLDQGDTPRQVQQLRVEVQDGDQVQMRVRVRVRVIVLHPQRRLRLMHLHYLIAGTPAPTPTRIMAREVQVQVQATNRRGTLHWRI